MDKLAWRFKTICNHNQDGSFATRPDRANSLRQISGELRELGYRHLEAERLKAKHVDALITYWKDKELATGTIKNRLSHLRWAMEKVGRSSIIPSSNRVLEIPDRVYVRNEDKSVDPTLVERIDDPHIRASLELCREFGLRREESMKIIPDRADRGDYLQIEKSKGNRPRQIPIDTEEKRAAVDVAKTLARITPERSLVPTSDYAAHKDQFKNVVQRAGFNAHGLRHAYAHRMYAEKTGWKAPVKGGPKQKELNEEQRVIDRQARAEISALLGHGEERETAQYLGR